MGVAKYPASKCLSIYNQCAGTAYGPKSQEAKGVADEVRAVLKAEDDKAASKWLREAPWSDDDTMTVADVWQGDWRGNYSAIQMVRKVRAAWAEVAS